MLATNYAAAERLALARCRRVLYRYIGLVDEECGSGFMTEQQMSAANTVETLASGDQRLEFICREALRGLVQQQGLVENLNSRAGNLIFAAAFVSSMCG